MVKVAKRLDRIEREIGPRGCTCPNNLKLAFWESDQTRERFEASLSLEQRAMLGARCAVHPARALLFVVQFVSPGAGLSEGAAHD